MFCFFFQAEDGIRDLVRSRGLGDVYKRQGLFHLSDDDIAYAMPEFRPYIGTCKFNNCVHLTAVSYTHLTLPTIYPV